MNCNQIILRESRVYPGYWNLTSLWVPIGYYELQYFLELLNAVYLLLVNLKQIKRNKGAQGLTVG